METGLLMNLFRLYFFWQTSLTTTFGLREGRGLRRDLLLLSELLVILLIRILSLKKFLLLSEKSVFLRLDLEFLLL